jgi:hypothetical protein
LETLIKETVKKINNEDTKNKVQQDILNEKHPGVNSMLGYCREKDIKERQYDKSNKKHMF